VLLFYHSGNFTDNGSIVCPGSNSGNTADKQVYPAALLFSGKPFPGKVMSWHAGSQMLQR